MEMKFIPNIQMSLPDASSQAVELLYRETEETRIIKAEAYTNSVDAHRKNITRIPVRVSIVHQYRDWKEHVECKTEEFKVRSAHG